jgi:hypothetical protein
MTDTLETRSPRDIAIAAKRDQAKEFKGVSFEPRSNKFTAVIRIRNERRWLGSFDTAEEAGVAYALARVNNPVVRTAVGSHDESFAHLYDEFLLDAQAADNVEHGRVLPGSIFTAPDGQNFRMERVEFFKRGPKGKWIFYCWSSACRTCGGRYETKTQGGKRVTGMTRNCADHRAAPKVGDLV